MFTCSHKAWGDQAVRAEERGIHKNASAPWPPARLLVLLGLALAMLLASPAAAEGGNPTLLPVTARGFVELSALNVNVSVQCPESCGLEIEQIYRLQNRDRLKGAEIQVALQGLGNGPAELSFAPASQAMALENGSWSLQFGPEEALVATVRYNQALPSPALLHWQWDGAPLNAWGPLTSARIELRLPGDAPSDIILQQDPQAHGYDGRTLHWEYEEPPSLGLFDIWLLTPTAWQEGQALRRQGDQLALASYYRELGHEATRTGAPLADTYPLALGALLSALAQEASPAPHLALAELYLERATQAPALALNYQLLAAEALEDALAAGTTEANLSEQLAQLYFEMAQHAHEEGNHTDALHYIGLARAYDPEGSVGDAQASEVMQLDWALDLASKGQVSEALLEAADALSPRVQDALYRYAPSIVAAHTEITLTTQTRLASYHFFLYPPLASQTTERLQALTDGLNALAETRAALAVQEEEGTPSVALTLEVHYASLADLAATSQEIVQVGATEGDLAQALIAAPWHNTLAALDVSRALWWDVYHYQERPAFEALEALHEEQTQYTLWRLVEASSGQPELERDRLELQLTALALREQREIWENLPSSSYWAYHVTFEEPSALPTMHWLVGWGQERELKIAYRYFWWQRIAQQIGLALGVFALIVLLVAGLRRRGRRQAQRTTHPHEG